MTSGIRIGALISGSGSNLQAILDACDRQDIDGRVVFVGSDRPDAQGLERARVKGIPTFTVDYSALIRDAGSGSLPEDFDLQEVMGRQRLLSEAAGRERQARFLRTRAVAEAALLKELSGYAFDLLILAGFMRVLTPYFIDRVNTEPSLPRIMNIHPSLLPSFPGVDGYGDTYRYGCKVGGCTVHFVDYGEDTGPIIGQRAFEIAPGDTLEEVRKKGLAHEWKLYPECVQLFARKRLTVVPRRHLLANGKAVSRRIVEIAP